MTGTSVAAADSAKTTAGPQDTAMPKAERVQKLLAAAGVGSRRACEEMIKAGRVSVNGAITTIGQSAIADDDIRVDGKRVKTEKLVHVLLNKPCGVTSTVSDRHAERTVVDLVKLPQRLFPVGRLDKESDGLMLLTNDGALMQRLTHPSHEVRKTYEVVTAHTIEPRALAVLRAGVLVDGKTAVPDRVEQVNETTLRITIHEGRKHIIRLMMAALGHTVMRLTRLEMGPLTLKGLKPGQWRMLTAEELKALQAAK